MSSYKAEVVQDLQEKYVEVQKLLEDAKKDPETEPYRSKYAASAILKDMKSALDKMIDDVNSDCSEYVRCKAVEGAISVKLGIIAYDTEELSTAEEHLTNCVDSLTDLREKPECIVVTLTALNQLGILWSDRDNSQSAKLYLELAETLYKNYTSKESISPFVIDDLFLVSNSQFADTKSENSEKTLEQLHTYTLYYLAQIYSNLDDHVKSAVYCHTTLRRQLESKTDDPIEWSLNSATLSQYFVEKSGYNQARHHLAAASYMLDQYEREGNLTGGTEDEIEAKKERFNHRSADVARCWAKYGLALLAASKDRLLSGDHEDSEAQMEVSGTEASQEDVCQLSFQSLELSEYEEAVSTKFALTFDDARMLFLNAKQWLLKAQMYYTKESHASDYVQVIQDMSQLYRHLVFFEEDPERQSRMQKRRVDLLEDVLKELNPQYYLLVCRQLWFELGETYSDMLEIKLTRSQEIDDAQNRKNHLKKVHALAEKSIAHFNKFLDSVKSTVTGVLPDPLTDDVMRPVLIGYFYLGRLYGKLVPKDTRENIKFVKQSLDSYLFVVRYCDKYSDGAEQMRTELSVCRDMAKLLPLKLGRLMIT